MIEDDEDDADEATADRKTRTTMRVASPEALFGPLPDGLKAQLEVVEGRDTGKMFTVTQVPCIIGRGRRANFQLDDDQISRLHAVIAFEAGEFRIVDNQSENGTYLNGSKVSSYRLVSDDTVRMASTTLRFSVTKT